MRDTGSIARLGRAVAVTLIAATQRPTQKAMGQGAVRSQMDLRICFRVRERKDVDLVLGQGMLHVGWDAHNLNAPGKFLVSAREHQTPKRARAYLLIDQAVTETAARYASNRPSLDEESQRAILAADNHYPDAGSDSGGGYNAPDVDAESTTASAEETLWLALCMAPEEGAEIGELIRATGMSRPTLYRRLAEHARAGRAVQSAVVAGARPPPRSLTVSDRSRFVSSHVSRARLHLNARTRPLRQTMRQARTVARRGGDSPHHSQGHQQADRRRDLMESHRRPRRSNLAARQEFLRRFEREVDPEGRLPLEERRRRADHAKRAYMLRLAKRSAAVRKVSSSTPETDHS